MRVLKKKAIDLIHSAKNIVFMTGAGVSVPSGIPDYRSMTGVYHGKENPEYLLSRSCLLKEPEVFDSFVAQLYRDDATPNVIHQKIAQLEKEHTVQVISQNIDGLHQEAGSQQVVNFHGTLAEAYCMKCQEVMSADIYRQSSIHQGCGGRLRPNVVLYEESLSQEAIETSIKWLQEADVVVIVGTTFKVYPFSGLIQYRRPDSEIIVVNKDPISLFEPHIFIQDNAEYFFADL